MADLDRDLFGVELGERVHVLTCGKVGPARSKLLAGTAVHLWTAETVEEAIEIASTEPLRACLVRFDLAGGTALDLLAGVGPGGPPVVVLLDASEWGRCDACIAAGARDVVELSDTEAILYVTGRLVGLTFGRAPRAKLDQLVRVEVDGTWHELETNDLRPSGVSVKAMPAAEVGSLVRLRIDIMDTVVDVPARVARRWERGALSMAGLQFLGLTKEQRVWLEVAVGALKVSLAESIAPEANFVVDEGEDPVAQSRWHLGQVMRGEGDREEHPRWIYGMIPELTPIEQSAAVGVQVPGWVHQALTVRLLLARYRDDCPVGPPPKTITEECQRLMDVLSAEREEAHDFDVAEQISLIKGRIIREFLEGPGEAPMGLGMGMGMAGPPGLTLPMPGPVLNNPPAFGRMPAPKPLPSPKKPPHRGQVVRRGYSAKPRKQDLIGLEKAQQAFLPLVVMLVVALGFAISVDLLATDAPPRGLTYIGPADLATPLLIDIEAGTDFATGVVSNAWYGATHEQKVESLSKLRGRLLAWEQPIRYLVLHAETLDPVALYFFEEQRLLLLDQPRHLIVSDRSSQ